MKKVFAIIGIMVLLCPRIGLAENEQKQNPDKNQDLSGKIFDSDNSDSKNSQKKSSGSEDNKREESQKKFRQNIDQTSSNQNDKSKDNLNTAPPIDNSDTKNTNNLASDKSTSVDTTKTDSLPLKIEEKIQKKTDDSDSNKAENVKNDNQKINVGTEDSNIKNSNPEKTSPDDSQNSSEKNSSNTSNQDSGKIPDSPKKPDVISDNKVQNPVLDKKDSNPNTNPDNSSKDSETQKSKERFNQNNNKRDEQQNELEKQNNYRFRNSGKNFNNSNSEDRSKDISKFEKFRQIINERNQLRNGLDKQNNSDSDKIPISQNKDKNSHSILNKDDYDDNSRRSRSENNDRHERDNESKDDNRKWPSSEFKNTKSKDLNSDNNIPAEALKNRPKPKNDDPKSPFIENVEGEYIYNFTCNKNRLICKRYTPDEGICNTDLDIISCGYAPAYVPFKIAKNNYIDPIIREYDDELFLHETKIKEIEKDLPPYGSSGSTDRQSVMLKNEQDLHNKNLKMLGMFTVYELGEGARAKFEGDSIDYYNSAQNIKNYIKEEGNKIKFSDTLDYVELKTLHDEIVKKITGFDIKKLPIQTRRLIALEEFRHNEEEFRIWRLEGRSPTKKHLDAFKAEDARFDAAVLNIKKKYGFN